MIALTYRRQSVCTATDSSCIAQLSLVGVSIHPPSSSSVGDCRLHTLLASVHSAVSVARCSDDRECQITCPDCHARGLPERIHGEHYCEERQAKQNHRSGAEDEFALSSTRSDDTTGEDERNDDEETADD